MIAQLATPSQIVSSFLLALGNRLQPGFLSPLPLGYFRGRVISTPSCLLVGPLPTVTCSSPSAIRFLPFGTLTCVSFAVTHVGVTSLPAYCMICQKAYTYNTDHYTSIAQVLKHMNTLVDDLSCKQSGSL